MKCWWTSLNQNTNHRGNKGGVYGGKNVQKAQKAAEKKIKIRNDKLNIKNIQL